MWQIYKINRRRDYARPSGVCVCEYVRESATLIPFCRRSPPPDKICGRGAIIKLENSAQVACTSAISHFCL
jgi:hypothetical protein